MKYFVHHSVRKVVRFALAAVVLCGLNVAQAQEAHEEHLQADSTKVEAHTEAAHEEGDKPFDPQTVIFEHIGDAHSWHLWGEHEHAVAIPLPVILHIKGKGMEVFMSSAFHHGTQNVLGKYNTYKIEEEHIKAVNTAGEVDEAATAQIIDISITKNVASMLLSVLIILLVFTSVASAYKKNVNSAPKGLQSFIEPLIFFVRDEIAIPNLGEKKYQRFMPFLLTVFFFIWINNLLGLLPAGANFTGNISVTLTLAAIVFVITNVNGNKDYWTHVFWTPGVPMFARVILLPVELAGLFIKPIALTIRLFANIAAGHIIVISLISLIFIFKSLAIAPVSIAFVLFMDVLELLVAFLQAFIFTMLAALFIGSAIAEHHHEEHGAEAHH